MVATPGSNATSYSLRLKRTSYGRQSEVEMTLDRLAALIAQRLTQESSAVTLTQAEIKTLYEANSNTNEFDDTEQTKLSGIETLATTDQSDAEIETAYDNQVTAMSQAQAEAGTSTTVQRVTAERIKQAIDALAAGSLKVDDEGVEVLSAATTLDFIGSGVVATSPGAGLIDITIEGGGGGGGDPGLGGRPPKMLVIQDQKTQNTGGGSSASGSWEVRDLNTVVVNEITGASLASNQITLPAGTYYIDASCAFYRGDRGQAQLYDTTGAAILVLGQTGFSTDTSGQNDQNYLPVKGHFTLAAQSVLEFQQRTQTSFGTRGHGVEANFGVEVYATVVIYDLGPQEVYIKDPMMIVQDEQANKVDPGASASGSDQTRHLNAVQVNQITGASVTFTITLATVLAAQTFIYEGLTFTAHASTTTVANREFSISGNDIADAAALVVCLTDSTYGVAATITDNLDGSITIKQTGVHPGPGGTALDTTIETIRNKTEDGNGVAYVTLPAGEYYVEASCPAFRAESYKSKLYDATGAATLLQGTSEYCEDISSSGDDATRSWIAGHFVLAAESNIELRMRVETTFADRGLGFGAAFTGDVEVYARMIIHQRKAQNAEVVTGQLAMSHQVGNAENSGTFTSGAWRTRPFNAMTYSTITGASITNTLTLASVAAAETLILGGLTFTAHATVTTVANREFSISGTDTADAVELAICINDSTYGVPGVTALASGATVILTINGLHEYPEGTAFITTPTITMASTDQLTLPAGTYEIEALLPVSDVDNHKAKLYNVTAAADIYIGSTERMRGTELDTNDSKVRTRFTLTVESVLEIRHWCRTTAATYGYGGGLGAAWDIDGSLERYATCNIKQLSV